MVSHSSILAWRIPWTEEPGGALWPWGHRESDMTEWLLNHVLFENLDFYSLTMLSVSKISLIAMSSFFIK